MRNRSRTSKDTTISFVETPLPIAKLMVSLISKPLNCFVLDTGCGKGIFLQALLDRGYKNINAIELSSNLAKISVSLYPQVNVLTGDYLLWNTKTRFDVIIGNPPYAHYNSLPSDTRDTVFKLTKTKETDIYYAFIIKSLSLLKPGGELIYIVPYSFFYNTHAHYLREQLKQNGEIEIIIDLDETRLFENEHPETIIFKFVKNRNRGGYKSLQLTRILRIKTRNADANTIYQQATWVLENHRENKLFHYFNKNLYTHDTWSTYKGIKINNFQFLEDIAFIGVGMVSGFDQAFRVKTDEKQQFSSKEHQKIFSFIKAANCKGYWTEGHVEYLLLSSEIKDEKVLEKEYPNIYAKLILHKSKMSSRYLPHNKSWFHWQALRNFQYYNKTIDKTKIFCPTLDRSARNRFSISSNRFYPSGDVLAIIPEKEDPYFLTGYLNSDFFKKYYLGIGGRRGHRMSFTQRLLARAKIPLFSEEEKRQVSEIVQEIIKKRNTKKREEIEEIILSSQAIQ